MVWWTCHNGVEGVLLPRIMLVFIIQTFNFLALNFIYLIVTFESIFRFM